MNGTNKEHTVVEKALGLLFIATLLLTCLKIANPFIAAIIGGIVICVSLWPLYMYLSTLLGNRRKLAATLMTIITIMTFVIPIGLGAGKLLDSIPVLENLAKDTSWLKPGQPPTWVSKIPLVGERLAVAWHHDSARRPRKIALPAPS